MIEIPGDEVLEQIAALASQGGEALTRDQVVRVLGAYDNILAGDPVGTILRDPATGSFAHRVVMGGVHMWRVSAPDGGQYNDLQPTLDGWEKIG